VGFIEEWIAAPVKISFLHQKKWNFTTSQVETD